MICARCGKKTFAGTSLDEGLVCGNCVNMEKYRKGEESFYLCGICGEADSPTNWMGDALEDELCFHCSFWVRKIRDYRYSNKMIVVDGNLYRVGKEEPKSLFKFRGHSGRKFTIEKLDTHESFISTNLWHNGQIPDRFRDKLPDDAKFLSTEINL
jgi:ribosomal protein L37E